MPAPAWVFLPTLTKVWSPDIPGVSLPEPTWPDLPCLAFGTEPGVGSDRVGSEVLHLIRILDSTLLCPGTQRLSDTRTDGARMWGPTSGVPGDISGQRRNGPNFRGFELSTAGSTGETTVRILVVEDDPLIREFVVEALREEGFFVIHAANGDEALALCGRRVADVLVTDIQLPGKIDDHCGC